MDKIYVITTLCIGPATGKIYHSRTVGWLSSLEIAEEVIVNNEGDIHEAGRYDHCVIEEMLPGLYPQITREEWFRWGKKGYIIIPKPDILKNSINFGIG